MYDYFTVIPRGERINGVLIIARSTKKLRNNNANESAWEVECICGKRMLRPVRMIITGAIQPCEACRAKYKMINLPIDS